MGGVRKQRFLDGHLLPRRHRAYLLGRGRDAAGHEDDPADAVEDLHGRKYDLVEECGGVEPPVGRQGAAGGEVRAAGSRYCKRRRGCYRRGGESTGAQVSGDGEAVFTGSRWVK